MGIDRRGILGTTGRETTYIERGRAKGSSTWTLCGDAGWRSVDGGHGVLGVWMYGANSESGRKALGL